MSDRDRQTLLQKLSWITYNDGVGGESERHSYDQNKNTLSETRKRFEHLLLSQTGRLPKTRRTQCTNKMDASTLYQKQ